MTTRSATLARRRRPPSSSRRPELLTEDPRATAALFLAAPPPVPPLPTAPGAWLPPPRPEWASAPLFSSCCWQEGPAPPSSSCSRRARRTKQRPGLEELEAIRGFRWELPTAARRLLRVLMCLAVPPLLGLRCLLLLLLLPLEERREGFSTALLPARTTPAPSLLLLLLLLPPRAPSPPPRCLFPEALTPSLARASPPAGFLTLKFKRRWREFFFLFQKRKKRRRKKCCFFFSFLLLLHFFFLLLFLQFNYVNICRSKQKSSSTGKEKRENRRGRIAGKFGFLISGRGGGGGGRKRREREREKKKKNQLKNKKRGLEAPLLLLTERGAA